MSSLLLVVAAFIRNSEGKILLSQRPEGKNMAGYWEFPGGKVNRGESPEEALKRELEEELDIQVSLEDLIPLTFISQPYKNFHLLLPFYHCRKWEGTIVGKENQPLVWLATEDFVQATNYTHKILPNDLPLVEYVLKNFF